MKTNKNRKGFTIVELVIVIAVIAILAAVLIPTFSGIIDSARTSQDTSLVTNINKVLKVNEILLGDPNDAVEVKKLLVSNNLKLETKSEGNYLWYDIEKNEVVLSGLNADGLTIAADSATYDLRNAGNELVKGKFQAPSAPENFINGYLFITEESSDGLAQVISALRSPAGNSKDEINTSISQSLTALGNYGNGELTTRLENLMNDTAVMTENGVGCLGDDVSAVTKIFVSADMKKFTAKAANDLTTFFEKVIAVDFHSGVTEFDEEALNAIKAKVERLFFYNSEALKDIAKDIENLKPKSERDEYIQIINLNYGDKAVDLSNNVASIVVANSKIYYSFPHHYYGTADKAYDFVGYSLSADGSNIIAQGTDGYTLTEDEKNLLKKGELTLYAIFEESTADFKVGANLYSSKETTYMLAEKKVPAGVTNITVLTNAAKLDASLMGAESADLYLDGVDLVIPYKADLTIDTDILEDRHSLENNQPTGYVYNFINDMDHFTGVKNLTVAGNVTLYVADDASIHVDARRYAWDTYLQSGLQTTTTSTLIIEAGSKIVSEGDITAMGIIRGEGTLETVNGTLTEVMAIWDWYGGFNAAVAVGAGGDVGDLAGAKDYDFIGKEVTPFNEWSVENIRTTTLMYGETDYIVKGAVYMADQYAEISIALASDDASIKPFFLTNINGTETIIEKSINTMGTPDNSRDDNSKLIIKQGEVQDTAIQIEMGMKYSGVDVSATVDFTQLPLSLSHFDIVIADDATVTLSKNLYKMMPGSSITVEEGGTLNINTAFVVCNSFDLVFKEGSISDYGFGFGFEYTYTTSDGGTKVTCKRQKKMGVTIFGKPVYTNSGSPVTSTLDYIPRAYSVTDAQKNPAELIINGTLNLGSGAALAGNITSATNGATIKVNANVGGYTYNEGFCYSANRVWYATYAPKLDTTPKLNGIETTLTSGTEYKYISAPDDGTGLGTTEGWSQVK